MNEKKLSTPEVTPQTEPREWVTPAFEQTALKDALSSELAPDTPLDVTTFSS